eukprot:9036061-Heterocapsa_arctica.AAC.1
MMRSEGPQQRLALECPACRREPVWARFARASAGHQGLPFCYVCAFGLLALCFRLWVFVRRGEVPDTLGQHDLTTSQLHMQPRRGATL